MGFFDAVMDAVRRYRAYRRARAELAGLDDRILRDIGVARAEIDQVARQAARGEVPPRRREAAAGYGLDHRPALQH